MCVDKCVKDQGRKLAEIKKNGTYLKKDKVEKEPYQVLVGKRRGKTAHERDLKGVIRGVSLLSKEC